MVSKRSIKKITMTRIKTVNYLTHRLRQERTTASMVSKRGIKEISYDKN